MIKVWVRVPGVSVLSEVSPLPGDSSVGARKRAYAVRPCFSKCELQAEPWAPGSWWVLQPVRSRPPVSVCFSVIPRWFMRSDAGGNRMHVQEVWWICQTGVLAERWLFISDHVAPGNLLLLCYHWTHVFVRILFFLDVTQTDKILVFSQSYFFEPLLLTIFSPAYVWYFAEWSLISLL